MSRHACEPEVSLEEQFDEFMCCFESSPVVNVCGIRAEIGVNPLILRSRTKSNMGLSWLQEFNLSSGRVRPVFMLQRDTRASHGVNAILVENVNQDRSDELKLAYLSAPKDKYPALQAGAKNAWLVRRLKSPQQLVDDAPEDVITFFIGICFSRWLNVNNEHLLDAKTRKNWSLNGVEAKCTNVFADIAIGRSLDRAVVIETTTGSFSWSMKEIVLNGSFVLPDSMRITMEMLANG